MDHRGARSGVGGIARRLILLASVVAVALAAALWVPSGVSAAPAASPTVQAVAMTPATVTLSGSLHPKARPEFDVGRMDPSVRRLTGMSLLFRMSSQQKALQKYAL